MIIPLKSTHLKIFLRIEWKPILIVIWNLPNGFLNGPIYYKCGQPYYARLLFLPPKILSCFTSIHIRTSWKSQMYWFLKSSSMLTRRPYICCLFIQGFHTPIEHLDELVQKTRLTGLSWSDIDKGVVIIAQVHIVKVFEMRGHFLDIDGTAVNTFTGV